MRVNCASWPITTTLASMSDNNVRCWGWWLERRFLPAHTGTCITLRIMARIDAHYLEDPCSGSRRMVGYLGRNGIMISRNREPKLMRRKG